LLTTRPTDLVFAVIEVPDRLQHAYYGYLDPEDERHESATGRQIRDSLIKCFQRIDDIVGLAHDYVGPEGSLVICSDHGFTRWEMTVHLNALLEQWGYLRYKRGNALYRSGTAKTVLSRARRMLPDSVTSRVRRQQERSAVDWSSTQAFASPKTYQMLFLNVRGREEAGFVEPNDIEHVKDSIVERFAELRSPGNGELKVAVWRSQDAFHGPAIANAPDIVPILGDNQYYLDTGLFTATPFVDSRDLPRGLHHMNGIGLFVGPGVQPGVFSGGSIMDVMPSLLYLVGLAVPEGLDGSVPEAALAPGQLSTHPPRTMELTEPVAGEHGSPYTKEEEAAIEQHLRSLGYL
jgi:predicted AlkP superfamily phosphohydrolase/phosphomutase